MPTGTVLTHYWDCCKPTCSQPDKPGQRVKTCNVDGDVCKNGANFQPSNSGYNPSDAMTCKDEYPWIEGTTLYGYGAVVGENPECGDIYRLTFKDAKNITEAYIMITNGGDSSSGNFDINVPGGGFGANNCCIFDGKAFGGWNKDAIESCTAQINCTKYGGFHSIDQCANTFGNDRAARKACEDVLFGIFRGNNPPDATEGCWGAKYPGDIHVDESKKINPCDPDFATVYNKLNHVLAGTLVNDVPVADDPVDDGPVADEDPDADEDPVQPYTPGYEDSCGASLPCTSGLVCDTADNKCRVESDGHCTVGVEECASGLTCDANSSPNICINSSSGGGACTGDADCSGGEVCTQGVCEDCDGCDDFGGMNGSNCDIWSWDGSGCFEYCCPNKTKTATDACWTKAPQRDPDSGGREWSTVADGDYVTRYWDCCKPSCALNGKGACCGPSDECTPTCGENGVSPTMDGDYENKSFCEAADGTAGMCNTHQPSWAYITDDATGISTQTRNNDMFLGTVAGPGLDLNNGDNSCGRCFELEFVSGKCGDHSNSAPSALVGKRMIVQQTNIGNDVEQVFDLMIPGGGMGRFPDGCARQWPGYVAAKFDGGNNYGGFSDKTQCGNLPSALQPGCQWRFDVDGFDDADNPCVKYRRVKCPQQLLTKLGTMAPPDEQGLESPDLNYQKS